MNSKITILTLAIFMTAIAPFTLNNAMADSVLYGMDNEGPDGPSDFFTIDKNTGDATLVGAVGFNGCSAMDSDSSGTIWAVCPAGASHDASVITINPDTGEGTLVSNAPNSHPFGDRYPGMSFRNSDGILYVYLEISDGLGTLDPLTGDLIIIGPGPNSAGNGIAFSAGDVLLHASFFEGLDILDQTDATVTLIADWSIDGAGPSSERINSLEFCDDTGILYGVHKNDITGDRNLVTIDPATSEVTTVGVTENRMDGLACVSDVMVGGELLPINNTSLLLAGLSSSAIWMIPTLAGLAGAGLYLVKFRANRD